MWQVIGQPRAVSLLQNSLKADNLSHAYLFVGPQHIGKMKLAITLAQALNCQAEDKPCLACDSCKKIAAGTHSDVRFIGLNYDKEEEAENKLIGIDQIRNIQYNASLSAFEGSCKVYIIDDAELFSSEASNCFLKTLEEPEPRVFFILLATNERRIPKTVISRCQRVELQPMPLLEEARALTEAFKVNEEKARLLAGLSHGCIGWAIDAANDEKVLTQRQEKIKEIISMIQGDYEERFNYVGRLAAGFTQDREAVYDVLDTWLDFWHDLMLLKTDCPDMITNIDIKDELIKLANNYSLSQIRNYIKSIESAALQLKQNINARLALEVLMLNIPREEAKAKAIS